MSDENYFLDGVILSSKLDDYNLNRYELKKRIDNGNIDKLAHGIYVTAGKEVNDFWLLNEKYKNGIYSHNTALYFYNLTDRTPLKYDMTFPSNNRINNEMISPHYIKLSLHKVGLTTMKLDDGSSIRIYDLERTICDLFRDRNKMDSEILFRALKEYLDRKDKNIAKLYEYAKLFSIDKVMIPFMEVVYFDK